jgi:hypothetical protein
MKTQEKKSLEFKKKNVVELTKMDQVNILGGSGPNCVNYTNPTRFTPPFCNAVLSK